MQPHNRHARIALAPTQTRGRMICSAVCNSGISDLLSREGALLQLSEFLGIRRFTTPAAPEAASSSPKIAAPHGTTFLPRFRLLRLARWRLLRAIRTSSG